MDSSHCHLIVGQLSDERQRNGEIQKTDTKMYRQIIPMMADQAL
jgi:hypothetical protein